MSSVLAITSFAQAEDLFVSDTGQIGVGNEHLFIIGGNVINDGIIAQERNSTIHFFGTIWVNRRQSNITDFGLLNNLNGGRVIFNTNSVWTSTAGRQVLQSFYNANGRDNNSFYEIELNNPDGLIQVGLTRINSQLVFSSGKWYLNNADLWVGSTANTLPRVLGYTGTNYVVTDAVGTAAANPNLRLINNPSAAQVVFPIGYNDLNYTPLSVNNVSGNRTFAATVFENVLSNGSAGTVVANNVVRASWQLRKFDVGTGTYNIQAQHGIAIETPSFTARRSRSFMRQYTTGGWSLPTSVIPSLITGGILTTGPTIGNAFVNAKAQPLNDSAVVTLAKWVIETERVRIPNAFSPNGDNINDKWVIPELNLYPNCKVNVYNRYGQPVFSASNGYSMPWDGTYNGKPLPIATYYYVIELESGAPLLSGYVMILR
jgi:gliding motility-associated-like protein